MIKMLKFPEWLNGMGFVRLTDRNGYYGPGTDFISPDSVEKKYSTYRVAILENRKTARKLLAKSRSRKIDAPQATEKEGLYWGPF